jgi:hypothetical protein
MEGLWHGPGVRNTTSHGYDLRLVPSPHVMANSKKTVDCKSGENRKGYDLSDISIYD